VRELAPGVDRARLCPGRQPPGGEHHESDDHDRRVASHPGLLVRDMSGIGVIITASSIPRY
jgi:hypothetical protein